MRLFKGKIPLIADDVLTTLVKEEAIELDQKDEAKLDLESVMNEYLRLERDIVDQAKNRMETRGLPYSHLRKVCAQVAKERGAPGADDALPYILDQLLHMLFHSNNVAEIYAEDLDMRKSIAPILRRHMSVEDDLDKEVRAKIKNLEEGTSTFEIEYARMMEQMKRTKRVE